MASEWPIVILDEPTSGLDLEHMRQVAHVVRSLTESGRTVVIVTRDPEFAIAACDVNIGIEHGHVCEAYPLDGDGHARLARALTASL